MNSTPGDIKNPAETNPDAVQMSGALLFSSRGKARKAHKLFVALVDDPTGLKQEEGRLRVAVVSGQGFDACLREVVSIAEKARMGLIEVRCDATARLVRVHAKGLVERRVHPADPRVVARFGTDLLRFPSNPLHVWGGVSPDGRRAVATVEGFLEVVELVRGALEARIPVSEAYPLDGAWYPDSDRFVVVHEKPARVVRWDLRDGSRKPRSVKRVTCVAMAPNGAFLVVGTRRGGEAVIIDAESFEIVATLRGHKGDVSRVAVTPDSSEVLTLDDGNVLRAWSAEDWTTARVVYTHDYDRSISRFSQITFLPGTRTVVLQKEPMYETTSITIDLDCGEVGGDLHMRSGWVDIHPDGQRAVGAGDSVKLDSSRQTYYQGHILDLNAGRVVRTIEPAKQRAVWRPGAEEAFFFEKCGLVGYDATTGERLQAFQGHVGSVEGVAFSPDGQRLASAGGMDRCFSVWDLSDGREVSTHTRSWGSFHDVAWSDHALVARADGFGNGNLCFFDPDTGALISKKVKTSYLHWAGMAMSPNGRVVAISSLGERVILVDVSTRARTHKLKGMRNRYGDTDDARRLAFTPDGEHLVGLMASDRVAIWPAGGEPSEVRRVEVGAYRSLGFAVLGDSAHVATGDANGVTIHRLADGSEVASFSTPGVPVAMAAHGDWLAVAVAEHPELHLIHRPASEDTHTRIIHGHQASSLAFSCDGSRLASGGARGDIVVWRFEALIR